MHPYLYSGHHALRAVGLLGFGLHLAVLAGLVVLGILLICLYRRRLKNQAPQASPTAMDILNKRYAKGEITQEDYKIMKENLK